MSISVLIPFRPDNERRSVRLMEGANRSQIFGWVRRRWEIMLPEAEIVAGEPSGEAMNRSQARNRAFEASSGDILVVADADVVVNPAQVDAALTHIDDGAGWVIAYQDYLQLDGSDTRALLAKSPDVTLERPRKPRWATSDGNAGLTVMTRAAWEAVSGYDERFIEWGWEDWAFANALETLIHGQIRVPGFVLHLRHPLSANRSKRQGSDLFMRYHEAHGDPEAMKKIIDEEDRHP